MAKRNRQRKAHRVSRQQSSELIALKAKHKAVLDKRSINIAQDKGKFGGTIVRHAGHGFMGLMLYGQAVKFGDGVSGSRIGMFDALPNLRGYLPNLIDIPSHGSNTVASIMVASLFYRSFKVQASEDITLEKTQDFYNRSRRMYIAGVVGVGTLVNAGMEVGSGAMAAQDDLSKRLLGGMDPVDIAYGVAWAGVLAASQMRTTRDTLAAEAVGNDYYFETHKDQYTPFPEQ